MFNNKSILITGGTGSFGKKFIKTVLDNYSPKRLVIFSRDELKQFEMSQEINEDTYPSVRYFLGDLRDKPRITKGGISILLFKQFRLYFIKILFFTSILAAICPTKNLSRKNCTRVLEQQS